MELYSLYDQPAAIVEQQALSDFSVTKCILAEPTNSSAVASCSEQVEKNGNNNNTLSSADVKQEGDTTLSGESSLLAVLVWRAC